MPRGTPADVEAACAAAREAQAEWAARPVAERAAVLLRYHDLVIANAQEILDLIQLESGKARIHAFEEVLDVAIQARYYGAHGGAVPQPATSAGGPAGTHHPRACTIARAE